MTPSSPQNNKNDEYNENDKYDKYNWTNEYDEYNECNECKECKEYDEKDENDKMSQKWRILKYIWLVDWWDFGHQWVTIKNLLFLLKIHFIPTLVYLPIELDLLPPDDRWHSEK